MSLKLTNAYIAGHCTIRHPLRSFSTDHGRVITIPQPDSRLESRSEPSFSRIVVQQYAFQAICFKLQLRRNCRVFLEENNVTDSFRAGDLIIATDRIWRRKINCYRADSEPSVAADEKLSLTALMSCVAVSEAGRRS